MFLSQADRSSWPFFVTCIKCHIKIYLLSFETFYTAGINQFQFPFQIYPVLTGYHFYPPLTILQNPNGIFVKKTIIIPRILSQHGSTLISFLGSEFLTITLKCSPKALTSASMSRFPVNTTSALNIFCRPW